MPAQLHLRQADYLVIAVAVRLLPGKDERLFNLDAYLRTGAIVAMCTDASRWGMGGWLTIDGKFVHHFACPISEEDTKMFGIPTGTPDGQQVWECLAVLGAIDMWATGWKKGRIVLKVRGDNVGALTLLITMRSHSPETAIIARGLALRLVDLSFPPDTMHTPGLSHVVADRLSRVYAPRGTGLSDNNIHPALATSTTSETPSRNARWYKAYSNLLVA